MIKRCDQLTMVLSTDTDTSSLLDTTLKIGAKLLILQILFFLQNVDTVQMKIYEYAEVTQYYTM